MQALHAHSPRARHGPARRVPTHLRKKQPFDLFICRGLCFGMVWTTSRSSLKATTWHFGPVCLPFSSLFGSNPVFMLLSRLERLAGCRGAAPGRHGGNGLSPTGDCRPHGTAQPLSSLNNVPDANCPLHDALETLTARSWLAASVAEIAQECSITRISSGQI